LKGVNAIVFLLYKPKGKNPDSFHSVTSMEQYRGVVNKCIDNKMKFGFDSCSAPTFLKAMMGTKIEEHAILVAEPCESGLFSSYINCHGEFFVCSFSEGEKEWKDGINVLDCGSFLEDV